MNTIFANEQKFAHILNKPVEIMGKIRKPDNISLSSLYDLDIANMSAILITSGCNKNDHYFPAQEMWEKKETALDKPFNVEHDLRKVIGHFTDVFMLDDNQVILSEPSDTPRVHLGVQISIYRQLTKRDDEWKEKIDDLIGKMWNGELFVSSEVIYPSFDYGLLDENGVLVERIVRDASTSFLTGNLRLFGGTGRYKDLRLCQILNDIIIVGGGLVERPANPHSVFLTSLNTDNSKDSSMSDDNKFQIENVELRKEVARLEEQLKKQNIAKYEESIASLEEQIVNSRKDFEAQCAKYAEEIGEKDREIEALEEAQKMYKEQTEGVAKEKEAVDAELAEAQKKLKEIEAENRREKRISALVEHGSDRAEAEALTDKFASLSDEQFEGICEMASKAFSQTDTSNDTDDNTSGDTTTSSDNNDDLDDVIDDSNSDTSLNSFEDDKDKKLSDAQASIQELMAEYI